MSQEQPSKIKLLVAGRRKPGMTKREYADFRYDVHAAVTFGPDKVLNPVSYIQNHTIDAALGAPADQPNTNHSWLVGRDDITECDFRDGQHMMDYFRSDYVQNIVAPDIPQFADLGGLIWLAGAREGFASAESAHIQRATADDYAAFYFLAAATGSQATIVPPDISAFITSTFSPKTSEDILSVELFISDPKHDLTSYFGRGTDDIPTYIAVVKLILNKKDSFATIREVQKKAEKDALFNKGFDLTRSFIALTRRSVVFTEDMDFDLSAKPDWDLIL